MRCKNCNKLIEAWPESNYNHYLHIETDDGHKWFGCKAANQTYPGSGSDKATPNKEYNITKILEAIDSHTTSN